MQGEYADNESFSDSLRLRAKRETEEPTIGAAHVQREHSGALEVVSVTGGTLPRLPPYDSVRFCS